MKTFRQYIHENSDTEVSNTPDIEGLMRIVNVAAHTHYEEIMQFLDSLGAKDMHIKSELDKLKGVEPDKVVPNIADSGGGLELEP